MDEEALEVALKHDNGVSTEQKVGIADLVNVAEQMLFKEHGQHSELQVGHVSPVKTETVLHVENKPPDVHVSSTVAEKSAFRTAVDHLDAVVEKLNRSQTAASQGEREIEEALFHVAMAQKALMYLKV